MISETEYGHTATGATPIPPGAGGEQATLTGVIPVVPAADPLLGTTPVDAGYEAAPPTPPVVTVPALPAVPAETVPIAIVPEMPADPSPAPAAAPAPVPVAPAVPAAEPVPAAPAAPPIVEAVPTGAIPIVSGTPLPPLDQWQFAPYIQWSMQHIESFLPVHRILRGERVSEFALRPSAELSALSVRHPWEDRQASFAEVMEGSFTDGWMVVHRGAIVGESYSGGLVPGGMHLLMSVSKSLTATVAGQLATAGQLDLERPVTDYVPELAGSGYDGALVRHLVDMRTGVRFSEEYLNDDAEVRLLEEAIGWAPKRHPEVPDSLLGFLATLGQSGPHGGPFDYKSCETDALGFVIAGATGRHPADVMSERLWQPMGAEFNAHVGIDSIGGGMFDGGVSAAMRDLARFGHLFVNGGKSLDGVAVLPEAWVEDTFEGGPDSRQAFADAPEPTFMPGGMYRNGFWFPGESGDIMLALGIHGQMIYINRATGVVAAKVSSWPTPQDAEKLFWTVRAFETASWALDRGEL